MCADCIITTDRLIMVALSGLAAWLGQVWATRISRKESAVLEKDLEELKTDLEKNITIHKIQFEKEFEVYLDLSKRIHAFRTAYFTLNKVLKHIPVDPDEAKKQQRELQEAFRKAYFHMRDGIEEYKPFYALQVYDLAKGIIEIAVDELMFQEFPVSSGVPRYKEIQEQKKRLLATVDSIAEEIRKRISSVRVQE